ncbi:MAG: putative hydroxymethylpyrimidine transporter CytX [Epulopiscium sp.]|nr:putative hydroxymethylpyrimidine transporter CytX [Candidatus Epulonipiscium sp.]
MINNEARMGFWTYIFLWFGAAISIAEILTGGLIAPLGFKKGLIVILTGHLIGTSIFALGGVIGTREKLPAIASTKISFGLYGTYLFSILNVFQLMGWTAVMIRSGANSINLITKQLWQFDNIFISSIVIGIFIALWIWIGNNGIQKINSIAVMLLFLLTLVLGAVIFKDETLLTNTGDGSLSLGGAMELNVVMALSWLPLIADYTRFAKSERGGVWGSFLGYFLGSSWMYTIGLGAAIVSNNPDPSYMMLTANLGIIALGIVLLSTVTTTFLDVYSAGISFLNLANKLSEKNVGVVMAIIGTAVAVAFPMEQYEHFLYAIGSVFAPLFAVVITDYFIIKKSEANSNVLINWGAFLVWVIGIIIYYQFIKFDFILGATVPAMLITGIIYIVTWRWTSNWKLVIKSQERYKA